MKIGCPTEIKPQEFRVGLTPNAALEAVAHGHQVFGDGDRTTEATVVRRGIDVREQDLVLELELHRENGGPAKERREAGQLQ